MSIDLKFVELTADDLEMSFIKYVTLLLAKAQRGEKTHSIEGQRGVTAK